MSASEQAYRAKYLRALEDHESLEKQTSFQLDLMRKTLINLSAAARGLDEQVDATVESLKDAFRGAGGPKIVEQMERVQAAVEVFERKRESENQQVASTMAALITEYRALQIPNELEKELKNFEQEVFVRLSEFKRYPDTLEMLVSLQSRVLDHASREPGGLWERLSGRTRVVKDPSAIKTQSSPVKATPSKIHTSHSDNTNPDVDTFTPSALEASNHDKGESAAQGYERQSLETPHPDPKSIDLGSSVNTDKSVSLDVGPEKNNSKKTSYPDQLSGFDFGAEDDYEKVSQRITMTLESLVERIEPNDLVKHKVDLVRSRIARGMDWYSLAITLEDIRDILMLRYLQVDEEFAQYLKRVNDDLQSIGAVLGLAVDKEAKKDKAAENFSSVISSSVGQIKRSISGSKDIGGLKTAVSSQLVEIQKALTRFEDDRRDEGAISSELTELMDKLKSIELESENTRELLRKERYRATHDSLTGLANREAYNERAFGELKRFRRYGTAVTIGVCDIDLFKKVNDTFGHQVGDKVIRAIANLLSSRLREVDFVARYGGEEFVVLMPETQEDQAIIVLDKIRTAISAIQFKVKEKPVKVSVSFGLSQFVEKDTVESAFERADRALYQAKENGRNCCVIAEKPKE